MNIDDDNDVRVEDFDRPTMIIRINNRYRDGMSDAETLEAMRRWWRINPNRNVEIALAVANGIVRGVFVCDGWSKDETGKFDFKYEFQGRRADDFLWNKYVGRSVRGLFPRGAANPIRYFNA